MKKTKLFARLKTSLMRMKKTEDITQHSNTLNYSIRNRTYKLGNFNAAILRFNDPNIPAYYTSIYGEHEQPEKFDEEDIHLHHGSKELGSTLTLLGAKLKAKNWVASQETHSRPQKD
jgi:hypothetical protein